MKQSLIPGIHTVFNSGFSGFLQVAVCKGRNFIQTGFGFMQFHEKFLRTSLQASLQPTIPNYILAKWRCAGRDIEALQNNVSEALQRNM